VPDSRPRGQRPPEPVHLPEPRQHPVRPATPKVYQFSIEPLTRDASIRPGQTDPLPVVSKVDHRGLLHEVVIDSVVVSRQRTGGGTALRHAGSPAAFMTSMWQLAPGPVDRGQY
jgi:hypothetical protein